MPIYDLCMAQSAEEALTTAEELLLLAIDPRTGELHSHPKFRLQAALAGAVMLDLFADGSLTLVDDRVSVSDLPDDHRYSAVLERIRNVLPPHTLIFWVDAFGYAGSDAKAWTIASCMKKGVIAVDNRPWLPPFPRTRYTLIDPGARSAVVAKVVHAVTADEPPIRRPSPSLSWPPNVDSSKISSLGARGMR